MRPSSTTYPHRGNFFPTTSSSGTLSKRLQTAPYCVTAKSSSGSFTTKDTTATALNSTYVTGRGPPTSSNNPQVWHPCGQLVLLILNAPTCFQSTSSSGTPTSRLQTTSSCFTTTSSSDTPLAKITTAATLK